MIDWLTNVTVLVTGSPHLPTKTHSGDDWLTVVTYSITDLQTSTRIDICSTNNVSKDILSDEK